MRRAVNAEGLRDYVRDYMAMQGKVAIRVRIWATDGEVEQLSVSATPGRESARGQRTHSVDFRSAVWDGDHYHFSSTQASAMKVLWEAWESGTPEISQATILERAESNAERLRDVFRGNAAWDTIVVPGESKGTFRLAE